MAQWQVLKTSQRQSSNKCRCLAPFGIGYSAASHAYRHQSQELTVTDVRKLLGLPETLPSSSRRQQFAEAYRQFAGSACHGQRIIASFSAASGQVLAEVAALELISVILRITVIMCMVWSVQDVQKGHVSPPWWLDGVIDSYAGAHVATRVVPLVIANLLHKLAEQSAVYRRSHLASEMEAAVKSWAFQRVAFNGTPDGRIVRALLSCIPSLVAAWTTRSHWRIIASATGAALATAAVVYLAGVAGFAAGLVATSIVAVEARVRLRVKLKRPIVEKARNQREHFAKELLKVFPAVKASAWERFYFQRLSSLREAEIEVLLNNACAKAWVAAFDTELLVLSQVMVIGGLVLIFLVTGAMDYRPGIAEIVGTWASCCLLSRQLADLNNVVATAHPGDLARQVEVWVASSKSACVAPAQGDLECYNKTRYAVSIEGMRCFWDEKARETLEPIVFNSNVKPGAPDPDTGRKDSERTECVVVGGVAPSLWGPPAKASAIASSVNPAQFADAGSHPEAVQYPESGAKEASRPLSKLAGAASINGKASTAATKTGGWELVDQVTDDCSVAERAARAAGSKNVFDLKLLCFQVKRGNLTAITGATGSGKSTLLAALCGQCQSDLWGDDAEGSGVRISGRLAYVPQKPVLMTKCSVRENVLFGLAYEPTCYEKALLLSTLAEDVACLHDGDASEVTDLRDHVSLMCMQLARAIYHEAEILLIDDLFVGMEAGRASRMISKGLKKLAKEKTMILATQNPSLLSGVGQIVVLRNGTVFEVGDFKTLTSTPTEFKRLQLISSRKDASRERERRQKMEGAPCHFLWYDAGPDPMRDAFPMDAELEALGYGLGKDLKFDSRNLCTTDFWNSNRGQDATATIKDDFDADTGWSARGCLVNGVKVREGAFSTIESNRATPRPPSSRSQGNHGISSARSQPRNERERLGGIRDRRGAFAFEAPEFADVQKYFDSLDTDDDRPLCGPPGAGQKNPSKEPNQRNPPPADDKDQHQSKEKLSLAPSISLRGQPTAQGSKQSRRPIKTLSNLVSEESLKSSLSCMQEDNLEAFSRLAPFEVKKLGSTAQKGKQGRFLWQLVGAGHVRGGGGAVVWLMSKGGGLAAVFLIIVVMFYVAVHLSVQYAIAALVSDGATHDNGPIVPGILSGAGEDDSSLPPSLMNTTIPPISDVAGREVGLVDEEGMIWRGFGKDIVEPISTRTSTSTRPTTTTVRQKKLKSAVWGSNQTDVFCLSTAVSSPSNSFECSSIGCAVDDLLMHSECLSVCEFFASTWGCRHVSWGGPSGPMRYCYLFQGCERTRSLKRYMTVSLTAQIGYGRILSSTFSVEETFDGWGPKAFLALLVVLVFVSALQANVASRVSVAACHQASLQLLRCVLSASICGLKKNEKSLEARFIEDLNIVDSHLPFHLPRFLGSFVHVLAAISAMAYIGSQQAIVASALALVIGLTVYFHMHRIPLERQLQKLRQDLEGAAMRRTHHLEQCHEVLQVHGRLKALCDDFEVLCTDVFHSDVLLEMSERWLQTHAHLLCVVIQGLVTLALLTQAGDVGTIFGVGPAAVALLQATLASDSVSALLRNGLSMQFGLAATSRIRDFWHTLVAEEIDSPALRMRAPTKKELKEIEEAHKSLKARNEHRIVFGDSVIERGSEEEQAFAMYDLARLEREQGVSVEGFPLESVADDWPYFGAVEFEKVCMNYATSTTNALQGATLTLPASSSMLLVGPAHAGKSSLLRALLRLWPTSEGRIVVDAVDVRSVGLTTLRSRIAYVPQDVILFEGTWRQNLDPTGEFSEEQLSIALRLTRLQNWMRQRASKGLEEPIDAELSVELRSVLGLTRAILRLLQRRSKLLLLDATTCRLDLGSDANLTALALRYCRRREVAVVQASRRVNQCTLYDSVAMMQGGRILESGVARKIWYKDGALRNYARSQGVDSSLLSKSETVISRLSPTWNWDVSPQEDPAWSDEFAVSRKKKDKMMKNRE